MRMSSGRRVDAVYIALPNFLHAEWTVRARRREGRALRENALPQLRQVGPVLETARRPGARLWEAFAFPFQHQHQRLLELVGSGAIGDPCEIVSWFHFRVTQPSNIRLDAELGGGAGSPTSAATPCPRPGACRPSARPAGSMVRGDRPRPRGRKRCRGDRGLGAARRVLGGLPPILDAFTPSSERPGRWPDQSIPSRAGRDPDSARRRQEPVVEHPTTDARSFSAMLRHIEGVLAGEEAPSHLAVEVSAPMATVVHRLQRHAGPAGPKEEVTWWRGSPF